jgi:dienelactone hydrolase
MMLQSVPMKISACLLFILLGFAGDQLSDPLATHWSYDRNTPLDLKDHGVQERDGITIHDISYSSPVADRGAAVADGGLVTAYLVIPSGKGPFPAIIYGHWCMPGSEKKNRTEFLEEAVTVARSGVISVLPDHVMVHPGFVEDDAPLNEQQILVAVQQVVNLRRAADVLLGRDDVDPKRLAYVGHSCDAQAGGFLSGIDKRFKAFVLMAGGLSDQADSKTKAFQDYRQKIGPEKFDAFLAKFSWMDPGRYVSQAAPASMFLQYATDEPFLSRDLAKQYFEVVSEPKKLKIYQAEHALNAEATRDRIAFLAEQLVFRMPSAQSIGSIPPLSQPPWPKP